MNREILFRGKRLDNGGGRQVSEITGPTRDLLTDLLSPLAHLGSIVAPIQDIRQILHERLPNFNQGKWVFGDLLTKHPHHEER